MRITGLEELVFGVDDVAGCTQYLIDYGLKPVNIGDDGGRFEAADGTAIVLRLSSDPKLPPAMNPSPSLRETAYGVADLATLDAIDAEVSKDRGLVRGADGSVAFLDDMGFALRFILGKRGTFKPLPLPTQKMNAPAVSPDIPLIPQTLSHVVYFVPDAPKAEAFYVERLGFVVSDRFTDAGPFLRCGGSTDHHVLFLIQTPPFMKGVDHFTFHFASASHALLAGTKFHEKGYQTFWGPGRHLFGSNWFWYFNSPFGAKMEFDAEMDQHDDDWVARVAPLSADSAQLYLFKTAEKWKPGPK